MSAWNFRPIWAIGYVTFREGVRDKILYNALLFAVVVLGIGFFASKMTGMAADRIVLDFGLSALGLSGVAVGVFTGASLLLREFERRTAQVALAHPISRFQFLSGKFLGIAGVVAANWIITSSVFAVIIGETDTTVAWRGLAAALLLTFAQSLVIGAVALMFSTFTTASLSSILATGIYLVGTNISQVRLLESRVKSLPGRWTLRAVAAGVPNLEHFSVGPRLTYGLDIPSDYLLYGAGYALCWLVILIFLSALLLRVREV